MDALYTKAMNWLGDHMDGGSPSSEILHTMGEKMLA